MSVARNLDQEGINCTGMRCFNDNKDSEWNEEGLGCTVEW